MAAPDAKQLIHVEIEKEGNKLCADCFTVDPGVVSLSLGAFICEKCAVYHRKLPADKSCVVSVHTHAWTDKQVEFIRKKGNIIVNDEFEKCIPAYYHRPNDGDPSIIREQFVLAKYLREEFKDVSQQSAYNQGSKTGTLFKRGKDNEKFLRRKFVLKEPEGSLQYFIKFSDRVPKDNITVRNVVNVYMVPDKVGNENGMQITYEKEGVRRNLFLFAEDARSTIDWYHAIRASMVKHKFKNFPEKEMKRYLNAKILLEGWMSKTGPTKQEKFRKRWFSLIGNMIWYYTHPLDAHPLGYIPLGAKNFGYGVKKGFPQRVKVDGYGMTIHTPERVYVLNCPDLISREKWVEAVTKVLNSCTVVWNPKEETGTNKNNGSHGMANNPNAFAGLSQKYEPPTVSNSNSSKEAIDGTPSGRVPLFEKKTNRRSGSGAKIAKMKKGSTKHNRSSTTKVRANQNDDYVGDDEVSEIPIETSDAEDEESDDSPIVRQADSKKFSDDSEEDWEKEDVYQLASDVDSVQDVVTVIQDVALDSVKRDAILPINSSREGKNDHNNVSVSDAPAKPPRLNLAKERHPVDVAPYEEVVLKEQSGSPSRSRASPETALEMRSPSPPLAEDDLEDQYNASELDSASVQEAPDNLSSLHPTKNWRENTFNSIRRLDGHERKSVRKQTDDKSRSTSSSSSSPKSDTKEFKEAKPRPVDITLSNQMDGSLWFVAFQTETEPDDVESYVTPWVGAQIAEAPASVGPIKIPSDFEIAVIDTAPGGFGLMRTTGPFYAEAGDVWEVDVPADDGSSPEMYYHEGMETDDGSIMLYANVTNAKKIEVAVFKSGRKLFSRRGIKPGESINIQIKPAIYLLEVDQDTFYDVEGQDLRASEYIPKATCIDLNYRQTKMRILAKKRGKNVFFTSDKTKGGRLVSQT
ncbi:uncharacterized protein LOC143469349 isoform X1 [Clavelina lepadiformis]|uniref:uncharacterized protein LOC143469349 isoform X1 n=1 Tax=Clavelina lepadiformis TaxID=159417 RepID=UPI0040434A85